MANLNPTNPNGPEPNAEAALSSPYHQRRPTVPFARSSRHKPRRWPLALRFVKGAIHSAIILPVLCHAIWSVVILLLDRLALTEGRGLGLPASIVPSLSIVVGLMLVFRNQTSYSRYWDGRNYLSVVITCVRNLARGFLACTSLEHNGDADDDRWPTILSDTERIVRILVSLLFATKDHLRSEWGYEKGPSAHRTSTTGLQPHSVMYQPVAGSHVFASATEGMQYYTDLLPQGLRSFEDRGVGLPLQLTFFVEKYIKLYTDGPVKVSSKSTSSAVLLFNAPQASQMHAQLNTLTDAYGRMETIRLTSIPVALLIHQKQVLALFGAVLPFALVDEMGWWTIPIVCLVMFTLYGIDGIGSQLEDPFGFDRNDIRMDAIVEDIREELMVLLDEWRRAVHQAPQEKAEMFIRRASRS